MPIVMHNLLEYIGNYFMASESLFNHYRDKLNDDAIENNSDNCRINNIMITISRSFEYKAKIIGSTPSDKNKLDREVAVPLK